MDSDLDGQLAVYRKGLLARIWAGGVFIALLVLGTSMVGAVGGRTYLYITVALASIFLIAYIFRKKIPYKARIATTLVLFFAAGLAHFVDRGMFGAGYFMFVVGILLAAMLYSVRAGIFGIAFLALLLTAVGTGFINGWIAPPFDLDSQSRDLNEWILFFAVVVLGSLLMLYAIGNYIGAISVLLGQVHSQGEQTKKALHELKQSQSQVLQLEKLASLGSLVAGVAHELNTPLGNALMSISAIQDRLKKMKEMVDRGELRRSALDQFFLDTTEMAELAASSSHRAAGLVSSFKQIAVDQTSVKRRQFLLSEVIDDVLSTLKPSYRDTPWNIVVSNPETTRCDSFPGPLGHALTNLIQNALIHAFVGQATGTVSITVTALGTSATITVSDDGVGMDAATLAQIFNPFFTTRLGQGTSGLGLSVAHNIAVGVLGGTLIATSEPNRGACFILSFPLVAPVVS